MACNRIPRGAEDSRIPAFIRFDGKHAKAEKIPRACRIFTHNKSAGQSPRDFSAAHKEDEMEYLIGAVFGAVVALIGAWIGGFSAAESDAAPPKETQLQPDGRGEALLRQWNNLLSYCGKEQHDEN